MKKLDDIVFWQARRVMWNTTHEKATAWKLINFSTFFHSIVSSLAHTPGVECGKTMKIISRLEDRRKPSEAQHVNFGFSFDNEQKNKKKENTKRNESPNICVFAFDKHLETIFMCFYCFSFVYTFFSLVGSLFFIRSSVYVRVSKHYVLPVFFAVAF